MEDVDRLEDLLYKAPVRGVLSSEETNWLKKKDPEINPQTWPTDFQQVYQCAMRKEKSFL